jgi:hypothetical protein
MIVIQDPLGVADQAQPSCAVTATDLLPPVSGTDSVAGDTE